MTQEKFRIIKNNFGEGKTFEEIVHTEPPHFHFQILRPESEEQREKAIAYFKEHKKIYTSFMFTPEILLYLGCTETINIRSKVADFESEQLKYILNEVALWFRAHINDKAEEEEAYNGK